MDKLNRELKKLGSEALKSYAAISAVCYMGQRELGVLHFKSFGAELRLVEITIYTNVEGAKQLLQAAQLAKIPIRKERWHRAYHTSLF